MWPANLWRESNAFISTVIKRPGYRRPARLMICSAVSQTLQNGKANISNSRWAFQDLLYRDRFD